MTPWPAYAFRASAGPGRHGGVGSALYVNGKQVAERKGRFTPTPLSPEEI